MSLITPCIVCGKTFSCNPELVPTVRVKGVKEPVCYDCIQDANIERKKMGLPLLIVHPDAYEAQRID